MRTVINAPGIDGSSDAHWQTIWERADPRFKRFHPSSWVEPELADWTRALERAVDEADGTVVLVAHSLGCLLVSHCTAYLQSRVAGAFLVSVPDPDSPRFPALGRAFRPISVQKLPFPSLIVASENDPYGTLEYSTRRALGHINEESGLGGWPQGRALFDAFCTSVLLD